MNNFNKLPIANSHYYDIENPNNTQEIDLSNYYTKEEVTELDNALASQIVDVRSELLNKLQETCQECGETNLENYYTKEENEAIYEQLSNATDALETKITELENADSTLEGQLNNVEQIILINESRLQDLYVSVKDLEEKDVVSNLFQYDAATNTLNIITQ